MSFVVMRYPVLMEDEGRHELIGVRDTREQAEALAQEESKVYWTREDFYILENKE